MPKPSIGLVRSWCSWIIAWRRPKWSLRKASAAAGMVSQSARRPGAAGAGASRRPSRSTSAGLSARGGRRRAARQARGRLRPRTTAGAAPSAPRLCGRGPRAGGDRNLDSTVHAKSPPELRPRGHPSRLREAAIDGRRPPGRVSHHGQRRQARHAHSLQCPDLGVEPGVGGPRASGRGVRERPPRHAADDQRQAHGRHRAGGEKRPTQGRRARRPGRRAGSGACRRHVAEQRGNEATRRSHRPRAPRPTGPGRSSWRRTHVGETRNAGTEPPRLRPARARSSGRARADPPSGAVRTASPTADRLSANASTAPAILSLRIPAASRNPSARP